MSNDTSSKEALEYLVTLGKGQAGLVQVDIQGHPLGLISGNMALKDMESYLPNPLRKKAHVEVRDAESFIAYINQHKEPGATLFYTRESNEMICALDYHQKDKATWWEDHSVAFSCPYSLEWTRWSQGSGKAMNQSTFAEFMEDNVKDVVAPAPADMLAIAKSFQAKTNVNFNSGVKTQNGDVSLEYTSNTTAGAGANGSLSIPETFFIGLEIYEGGKAYKVECRLKYRIQDGRLSMWYEIINKELLIRTAFDAELEKVRAGIGSDVMQINGHMSGVGGRVR